MTVFTEVLTRLLRQDSGRPLVTFYDDATGERTELSVATYANWVAKAGSLLVDEIDLERGMRIRVDLPPHWLTTVFLGAAWSTGLVVTDDSGDGGEPEAVVTGPDGLDRWSAQASERAVLACSLRPLGVRFAEPLPPGVHDVGVEIWSQPDSFVPWDPPSGADPAVALAGATISQDELWEAAAAGTSIGSTGGDRLLSEVNPASPPGIPSFTGPLRTGGSVVLAVHAGPDRLEAIAVAERVTGRFPRVAATDVQN
ncbi:TIGR03089 family protein [Nocardioides terrae]|uniref:TIGR03089 family protein n=1 Tax=Nocardioides terrae TaxID=574651 RepID=A0A1I1DRA5_9ACTN|nr:TIGR03089 family protein [Nocardioides terrae]SFB75568.1 TIGR03089 family protein [Nocardioides terrae]